MELKAQKHRTKYVELPVEGLRTRVRFPPAPPPIPPVASNAVHVTAFFFIPTPAPALAGRPPASARGNDRFVGFIVLSVSDFPSRSTRPHTIICRNVVTSY